MPVTQKFTLGELAQQFSLELRGDRTVVISGVCTLTPGVPGCLGFLANPKYRNALAGTTASAVILKASDTSSYDGPALLTNDPYLAFARIASLFSVDDIATPGIHPNAIVSVGAQVHQSAMIAAGAVLGEGVQIGAHTQIRERAVIGPGVKIGTHCHIHAGVVLEPRTRIGDRVRINPNAVIGSRGFGLAMGPAGWEDVPQLGGVFIGDDVEIGSNSTVDRGALGDTVISNGVKIDNLVQIAHNVFIGEHTAIAGCVGIAGSTRVGARCLIGGGAGLAGHIEIADGVVLMGMAMVTRSILQPGQYGSGVPVEEVREYRKLVARVRRLDKLESRVKKLEKSDTEGSADD